MNIPNTLTLSRIALTPVYLLLYLYPSLLTSNPAKHYAILLALVCYMLITDALDGYLARKMSKETSAGKILDPMSDCVLFLTIFFSFSLPPVNFPIWIPLMMMFREIVMVYLRSFLMMKNCVVGARLSGKLKTILQSVAVILVLAFLQLSSLGFLEYERVSSFLIFFGSTTALVSITSLIEYLFFYKKDVQEILKT